MDEPLEHEDVTAPADPAHARHLKTIFHAMTLLGLAGVATLVVLGFTSGVLTSVASLREFVDGFGVLAPLAFIAAGSLESVFPVIPGSGTIISAPIIFGHVEGTIYAYLATVLGSIVVFFISRHVGRDLAFARFSERTLARYGKLLDHPKFTKYFAIAIALPLAPDDVLCYLAGLTAMRWRTYLLIIVLCKPWGVLLYTTGVMAILRAVFPWLGL
ncbi:TVP38/TMEM64 family protein [Tessaracoccus lubricantis]